MINLVFPADEVGGATVSSQPADSTSCASDTVRKENLDEDVLEDEGGEPSTAELRRRRLRKLDTASPSSSSPPPLDNWSMGSDSEVLLWTIRNFEMTHSCFPVAQVSNSWVDSGQWNVLLKCLCETAAASFFSVFFNILQQVFVSSASPEKRVHLNPVRVGEALFGCFSQFYC